MKPKAQEFQTKKTTVSTKFGDKIKVKKKEREISLKSDKIQFDNPNEYISLLGITSVNRTPLYHSNPKYVYLLELSNNLDYIATSILGGQLEKMLLLLERETNLEKQKCQFFVKNNIIYLVYGSFPDKKGKWILEQMANHYSELTNSKDVDDLEKYDKYQIQSKFKGVSSFILKEYSKLQDVFSDQDLPYVEDKIRIDYLGLSSRSIGVISLLLGDELNVEAPGEFENPEDEKELKESLLTAKIEAIAANTLGNTGAVPRWIAVKLGYQHYRFLTFKKYPNDFFLYFLTEGNLEKLKLVEERLDPIISNITQKEFLGNLKPFNEVKSELTKILTEQRMFS